VCHSPFPSALAGGPARPSEGPSGIVWTLGMKSGETEAKGNCLPFFLLRKQGYSTLCTMVPKHPPPWWMPEILWDIRSSPARPAEGLLNLRPPSICSSGFQYTFCVEAIRLLMACHVTYTWLSYFTNETLKLNVKVSLCQLQLQPFCMTSSLYHLNDHLASLGLSQLLAQ
jgi:hypothetical protein